MNARQKRFIAEYLKDPNATKAAKRAGYSAKTAKEQGCRLLTNVHVMTAVREGRARLAEKLEISAERILRELALLGFSNMQDYIRLSDGDAYVDFSNLTRDQAAAIQEITVEEYTEGHAEDARDIKRVKFKLAEKRGALELLGKNLKLFSDRVEHTGAQGGPIVTASVELKAKSLAELAAEIQKERDGNSG